MRTGRRTRRLADPAHAHARASIRKSITDAIIGSVVPQRQLQPAPPLHPLLQLRADVHRRSRRRSRHQDRRASDAGADRVCNTVGASILFPEARRSWWSISAPPPTSTWSTRRAATAAARSRPASTCRSRRWSTPTALLPRIVVEKPRAGDRHHHGRRHAVPACSGAMSA